MELKDVVAVSALRTPMGRFGGTLKNVPSYDLGGVVIKESLKRTGINPREVDEVILGSCRQAGNGPNPARSASLRGGMGIDVPVCTLNMACPSGMKALALASQAIRLGEAQTVLIGGFDSMSTIPYLIKNARWDGFKMGNRVLEDGWSDSVDPVCNMGMGATAENLVEKYGVSREDQDRFAYESHIKAAKAREEGWFKNEIVPVEVPQKRKDAILFDQDETIRADTTPEKMAKLPAVFKKNGTVTAGNACGMSDGATAIFLMTREQAKALGLTPLFSIVSYAQAAVEPEFMGEGPGIAIPKVLESAGMTIGDMDFIEVNEAFAVQVLVNERTIGWDRAKLNVHGGAIALGHPTGISGARIIVTLYNVLKQHNGELGVAGICGGGGVTMATVIRRES